MKKIVIAFIISLLVSCTDNYDFNKAQEVSAKGAQLIKDGNYRELAKLYSYDFSNSETPERREEKLKKIIDATGEIKEIKLIDTAGVKLNDNYEAMYRYKLFCTHVNVIGYFTVIKEKGDYCISKIRIEQELGE
jgi:hypothetical protein